MFKVTLTDGVKEEVFFVRFDQDEDRPDPKENRHRILYDVKENEDSRKKSGIYAYKADDKVSGGGTYPVKWRFPNRVDLSEDLEFPLAKGFVIRALVEKWSLWLKSVETL